MSFTVLITLTTAGGNTGPNFDLYSDSDSYATPFETDVTKTNLVAGYTATDVPDGSTIIRCTSKGTCTNHIDISISGLPGVTPTPTVTSTPTGTPIFGPTYQFRLGTGATANDACNNWNPDYSNIYFSNVATLVNGSPLYTEAYPLQNPAPNGYYGDGANAHSFYCVSGTLEGQADCFLTPTPTPTATLPSVGVGIYTGATFLSSTAACADSNYPNGGGYIAHGDTISNGDVIYTDSALTTNFVGNGNYYRIYQNGFYACQISSYGTVSNLLACGGTTPTPTVTATPTATPTFFYYNLTRSTCSQFGTCVSPATGYKGRSSTQLVLNNYYSIGDGYVYQNTGGIGGDAYDVDLDGSNTSSVCSVACSA